MEIFVKVGKMPGRVEEVVLQEGATVADAIEAAGHSVEGFSVKLNGDVAESSASLSEGDTVLLVQQIKGN